MSSSMNRKAINAIAIRSCQDENGESAGGSNKSLEGTRALKSGSEDVTRLLHHTHRRLMKPQLQLVWGFTRGGRSYYALIGRVDKSLRLKVTI
jgi:hypothetical protein